MGDRNAAKLLTRDDVDKILRFLPRPTYEMRDCVRDINVVEMRNYFEDALSEVQLIPSDIETFHIALRNRYVDASSLVGDSMVRSGQSFAKTLVQNTISTKRGNDGKQEHISSVAVIGEVIRFAKKRSMYRGWLWPSDKYDDNGKKIRYTLDEVDLLSKNVFCVTLSYIVLKSTVGDQSDVRYWDVPRNEPFFTLTLDVSRMLKFRITPRMVVLAINDMQKGLIAVPAPMHLGRIDVYFTKNAITKVKNMASYVNRFANIEAKSVIISGIPGVIDSDVIPCHLNLALSECYRTFDDPDVYRFKLNRAQLHNEFLKIEDAIDLMEELYDDVEYDFENEYFYVRSKENPTIHFADMLAKKPEMFIVYCIEIEMGVEYIPGLYSDSRFDADRTLMNNLHEGYYNYGIEYAFQWSMYELRSVSDKDTDFHTHHPILERMFALGYPTPVTEKGHKDRNIGVLSAITFGKGEDTMRQAAIRQSFDLNNNVYSCHKTGTPAPFGSTLRLGMAVPYVSTMGEIATEHGIKPYRGAVATRFKQPEYQYTVRNFMEEVPARDRTEEVSLESEEFVADEFAEVAIPTAEE